MTTGLNGLAPDELIQNVIATAATDSVAGITAAEAALSNYPDDARLHFLNGSLLIGEKRFIAAHVALTSAVELDQDFHLARFQLGFFELTSGEAVAAQRTWLPLKALPTAHYLHRFVEGLEHLIADRFSDCIAALSDGIEANHENLPLNADMRLIIERCNGLLGGSKASKQAEDDEVSATSLLLGKARNTRQ